MDTKKIADQISDMTKDVKTMGELQEMLSTIVFTVGGLVCFFPKDERSSTLIELTQSLGYGLQFTAKEIGEPSDIEMIVGKAK